MGNATSNTSGPLAEAIIDGDVGVLKDLVRTGQHDVNTTDALGRGLLHLAAVQCRADMITYLCSVGTCANQTDQQLRTPLFYACDASSPECIRALLKGGANPNQVDSVRNTPLHVAVMTGREDVVKALLEADDIDTSAKGAGGRTAAAIARDHEFVEILQLLSSRFDLTSRRAGGHGAGALAGPDGRAPPTAPVSTIKYSMKVEDAPLPVLEGLGSPDGGSMAVRPGHAPPRTPAELLAEAQAHVAAGRFEAGIAQVNRVLNAVPGHGKPGQATEPVDPTVLADAHLLRGEALQQLGQDEAGAADFTTALGLLARDDRLRRAMAGRAACSLSRGQAGSSASLVREAVSDFELALKLAQAVEKVDRDGLDRAAAQAAAVRANILVSNAGSSSTPSAATSSSSLRRRVDEAHGALEALDAAYARKVAFHDKDHYAVLKITRDADEETIKAAYRTLSRALHPDKMGWAEARARDRAAVKFRRLNDSYSVLIDPTRRTFYDMELKAKDMAQKGGP